MIFSKLSLLLMTGPLLDAQAATLSLGGPATARPGTSVTLALAHDAAGAVAFQWTITSPWTVTNSVIAAGKTLSCFPDGKLCFMWALTTAVTAPGQLANITLAIPANQAPGPVQITVGGTLISNASAMPIAVVGSSKTITVLAAGDITGDGRIDSADVLALIGLIIGGSPGCDLNGDGKCDVFDIVTIVRSCTAVGCI